MRRLPALLFFLSFFIPSNRVLSQVVKHRAIILTDIEADPDDTESMIRLLLYSNEIDIRGLIATTSTHQKDWVAPESIIRIIRAYDRVQPNLLQHAPGYPTGAQLLGLVKRGQAVYGFAGVGEGKDSPGSEWIIQELEKPDSRPLWITVWGGPNTLAQALFRIRQRKNEAEVRRLIAKLRVYTISDQDDSGGWIRKEFPELFYIVSPGGYFKATWLGINSFIPGIDNTTISNAWLAEHIQQGHGPLGALYPDVGYGMEGDTPSWLSLIPNGLNAPEHPDWGGWGGRYEHYLPNYADLDAKGFTGGVPVEPETRAIWTNAVDSFTPMIYGAYGANVRRDTVSFADNKVTIWRWRDDFQHDFAARMQWTTTPYAGANHPPHPALRHPDTLTVHSGERFHLDAGGTTDPDGDNLSYVWFQYREPGTLKTTMQFLTSQNLYRVLVVAPAVQQPETTHFILRVTDKGAPALSRYKRVIVRVLP